MSPLIRWRQVSDGTHAPTLLERKPALPPLQLRAPVQALAIEPLHLKQHGTAWIELPRIRQHPPDEDPGFTRAAADHRGGILSTGLRSSPDQTAQQKQQKQHQSDAADRP